MRLHAVRYFKQGYTYPVNIFKGERQSLKIYKDIVRMCKIINLYTLILMVLSKLWIYIFSFMFVGPTTHHFYIWLDQAVPRTGRLAAIKRIILDRFIFAPPWLMVYFYVLALLEVQNIFLIVYITGIFLMINIDKVNHTKIGKISY